MERESFDLFGHSYPGGRFIGEEEIDSVSNVLKAKSPYRFYGLNPQHKCDALERKMLEVIPKRQHALCVSSGTAALHVALMAMGIGEGDEVILGCYGWISDIQAILAVRAVPVIVPLDRDSVQLDATRLEQYFTPQTRAVIAVHMRGHPCDIAAIQRVCRAHRVLLLEDGAQCFGGVACGEPVGSWGDASIFSFQYHKCVTAGEGGVVLLNDEAALDRARKHHDCGLLRTNWGGPEESVAIVHSIGLNYRMGEMNAACILEQLQKRDKILSALAQSYAKGLQYLAPLINKFELVEAKLPENSQRNGAFLILLARDAETARLAVAAMFELEIPATLCSKQDAHTGDVWADFMARARVPHRVEALDDSLDVLRRAILLEVAPDMA